MKLYALPMSLLAVLLVAACSPIQEIVQGILPESSSVEATDVVVGTSEVDTMQTRINIQVGNRTFTARLLENPSSQALVALLPMTVSMTELNRNEKYYTLPNDLPTNAEPGGNISSGDLMLYGSNTLVLFYESFNTSYSYTRLGYLENATELASTLGSGNVEITLSLED